MDVADGHIHYFYYLTLFNSLFYPIIQFALSCPRAKYFLLNIAILSCLITHSLSAKQSYDFDKPIIGKPISFLLTRLPGFCRDITHAVFTYREPGPLAFTAFISDADNISAGISSVYCFLYADEILVR